MVQVSVTEGILEGEVTHNKHTGKLYCSFKGIPYAQPPIGDLRFKAPHPPKPWTGVREAKAFGGKCYQLDMFTKVGHEGTEDCLYLNVYTPNIKPDKPLPVMFWIHGGAFVCGSGEDDLYGPQFLINNGVILVTINYRLEVLGFLCLDTEDIPGNAGMKDQVAALRWTHTNISNFGGDPNNITIFGESAGGVCTSYHCVSPMTKDYFKRAIVMSRSSDTHWGRPRQRALALARRLGCYSEDDKELYEFFKNQPVESLIRAQAPMSLSETVLTSIESYFTIVNEKKFGDSERFFHEDISSTKVHVGIDIMVGYTADEGVINLGPGPDTYKDKINLARDFPEVFVPKSVRQNLTVEQQCEFGKRMRKYYFKRPIKYEDWDQLAKFYAMDMFVFPTMQWVKGIASTSINNLFLYVFSCTSERNLSGKIFGVEHLIKDKSYCGHADELPYIFDGTVMPQKIESETMEKIERVTKMWTDFAKFGNPTPDDSTGVKWLSYTKKKPNYLDIGNVLVSGKAPGQEELEFWTKLHKDFEQKVIE